MLDLQVAQALNELLHPDASLCSQGRAIQEGSALGHVLVGHV
jgi:hypothetical protein